MDDIFIVITFPKVQELMEREGFEENSEIIISSSLIKVYGQSAYFVRLSWINFLNKDNNNEDS